MSCGQVGRNAGEVRGDEAARTAKGKGLGGWETRFVAQPPEKQAYIPGLILYKPCPLLQI